MDCDATVLGQARTFARPQHPHPRALIAPACKADQLHKAIEGGKTTAQLAAGEVRKMADKLQAQFEQESKPARPDGVRDATQFGRKRDLTALTEANEHKKSKGYAA